MDIPKFLAFFCILLAAPTDCEALDLIQLPGTQHSLVATRTGSGSYTGSPEAIIDGDFETFVSNSSYGSHEGHIDNSSIVSEHTFPFSVKLNEVLVKFYALGQADGATEYTRESGWSFDIAVKRLGADDWAYIKNLNGHCRHTNVGPVVCAAGPETFDFPNLGQNDVTALQLTVGAGGVRVGGAGYSQSVEQLYEVQAFGVPIRLPGDYNENGVVDAADYTVWRDHLGGIFMLPNEIPAAATPGIVDAEDYAFWKTHFGDSLGSGAGATANSSIPEPATLVLLVIAVIGWSLRRGRAALKFQQFISA